MRLRKLMCTAMSAAIVASMAGCGPGKAGRDDSGACCG